jgi:hypothetical protein
MNHPSLIFVTGLPGSGKTTLLEAEVKAMGYTLFDDFHANAVGHQGAFGYARRLPELLEAVRSSTSCVICDCRYCHPNERERASAFARGLFPDSLVSWWFFENAPDQCVANVRARDGGEAKWPLEFIAKHRNIYVPQPGARVLPVYRPVENQRMG